jgi:hypothetical protein
MEIAIIEMEGVFMVEQGVRYKNCQRWILKYRTF